MLNQAVSSMGWDGNRRGRIESGGFGSLAGTDNSKITQGLSDGMRAEWEAGGTKGSVVVGPMGVVELHV